MREPPSGLSADRSARSITYRGHAARSAPAYLRRRFLRLLVGPDLLPLPSGLSSDFVVVAFVLVLDRRDRSTRRRGIERRALRGPRRPSRSCACHRPGSPAASDCSPSPESPAYLWLELVGIDRLLHRRVTAIVHQLGHRARVRAALAAHDADRWRRFDLHDIGQIDLRLPPRLRRIELEPRLHRSSRSATRLLARGHPSPSRRTACRPLPRSRSTCRRASAPRAPGSRYSAGPGSASLCDRAPIRDT